MSIDRMPITNIDGINIRYDKKKHIRNHFNVAIQVRALLKQNTFTIWNEGADKNYSYVVQNLSGAWRVYTRQVWIDDVAYSNVVDRVEDEVKVQTSLGNQNTRTVEE